MADLARAHQLHQIVDIGAGSGVLLKQLAHFDDLLLTGIERRPPSAELAAEGRVSWLQSTWTGSWSTDITPALAGPALIVAVEFLDDLPAAVVDRRGGSWHHRRTDDSWGPVVSEADAQWLDRWWDPEMAEAEVGRARDATWAEIARLAAPGSILAVLDYGHLRGHRRPTFTGYRDGRQVRPQPPVDRLNLTAHVAIDAVDAAVRATGASQLTCCQLRDLPPLAIDTPLAAPPADDPLAALASRSERALVHQSGGPGDFWWLTHRIER